MAEKQNTPEIRFKGFTDPWEQRKLGDVAAVYDGVHQTPDYQDEGVMFLSVENIATLTSQKFISREAFAKDYPVYPKHGDVLMTRIGDIGTSNVVETDDKLAFYVSLALLKPFDVDSYYLDKSLQSPSAKEELYRRTLHIAFPKKINKNQIAEVMLPIPRSRQEQEQIGALFRDLDSLITLHQRKHDKLCTVKRSMLDKMFPKPGETEPEIRFKGFTDPWEQRKLNQFIYVTSEKNVDGAFVRGDVLSVSREEGVVNQIEFQGRSFAGADVSVYGILRHGDIVYTKSPLRANPYGIIKTNKGRSGIVSTLYATYRARPGVDSDFIQCYFDQDARLNNYLHPLVNKGAKNDMKVSAENAITGNVCFPGCEEQRLISSLFDRLDNLITLHQRKLDLLKNTKKSLLDKMFV